ncbi:MAG: hypothetical protein AB8B96_14780 [Lysobacterales bacterium]
MKDFFSGCQLAAALLLVSAGAVGAEFCATTGEQLQARLNDAEINGEADTIRLAQGTYVSGADGFTFDTRNNPNGDDFGVTIIGGWTSFFGNPCGQQLSPDPLDTLLDGEQMHRTLRLFLNDAPSVEVTIKNLSFINGATTSAGGGLFIGPETITANIRIENNLFLLNEASQGAALFIESADIIRIRNNAFSNNHSTSNSAVGPLRSVTTGIYFTNNTVINNTTELQKISRNPPSGLTINVESPAQSFVANNIFWNNQFDDLTLVDIPSAGTIYLYNNNIQKMTGMADESANNVAIDPQFETGLVDFLLSDQSPMIDAGLNDPFVVPMPPIPFELDWQLGSFDILSNERRSGDEVDIGAHEVVSPLIFADGFE